MPYIDLFTDTSEHYATMIEGGECYSVLFSALAPFSAAGTQCSRSSAYGGTLTLSLYTWLGSYDKTISAAPVATGVFDLANGTYMELKFAPCAPGDYLFAVHDGTVGAGFCGLLDSAECATLYMNGTPADGSMEARLFFENECGDYFGCVPLDEAAEKKVSPPDEPILPRDHIINRRAVNPLKWDMEDGLGRYIPAMEKTNGKKVGMFYWDWAYRYDHSEPVNVHRLMCEHPELKNDYHNPIWQNYQADGYFWNEPVYGYYTSDDRYVIRRQAELFAAAGIDFIVFDCTNGAFTWKLGYETVFEVFAEARAEGVKTPQIVFMFNFAPFRDTATMIRRVYTDIYRRGRFRDLWFYYEGKPLVICHNDILKTGRKLDNEILDFFTYRRNDPLYFTKTPESPEHWGWLSLCPQAKYGQRDDGSCEQMTVGVAHNASEHGLVPMNDIRGGVFGRSHTTDPEYSYSFEGPKGKFIVNAKTDRAYYYGLNYQEQWDHAIASNPDIVFITGYNEWVAGRHEVWQDSPNAFPDEFNDEFSRDIEPSKGDLRDFYYCQTVANIRRFKRSEDFCSAKLEKTININGDLSEWSDVKQQGHPDGNAPERDNRGFGTTHYVNHTSRNNIISTKICHDAKNIYFYAKCADNISPDTDRAWMRLFISTDRKAPAWESFNYVISRERAGVIERSEGGWKWQECGPAAFKVTGNTLVVSVPRAAVGLDGSTPPSFACKWADNTQADGDILDFYTNGNVTPPSRFRIVY